jgi:hypothetical protein
MKAEECVQAFTGASGGIKSAQNRQVYAEVGIVTIFQNVTALHIIVYVMSSER